MLYVAICIRKLVVAISSYLVYDPAGHESPTMPDLLKHVIPSINDNWRYLAYELLEPKHSSTVVPQIEGNIKGDVKQSTERLFNEWLKLGEDTSWKKLIKAIYTINLIALSQEIAKKLLPGTQLLL